MDHATMMWPLILFAAAVALLFLLFVRDLRKVLHREPIKRWFLADIEPDNPFYDAAAIRQLGPYLVFFGILFILGFLFFRTL
ncbi:MAG TPA: hypothetical protein VLC29_00805 [Rhizomicrobium sp.]|nr:hypothetical protein [Rhizomicrobium sp.]